MRHHIVVGQLWYVDMIQRQVDTFDLLCRNRIDGLLTLVDGNLRSHIGERQGDIVRVETSKDGSPTMMGEQLKNCIRREHPSDGPAVSSLMAASIHSRSMSGYLALARF
jgi:hypothetical protein